MSYDLPQQLRRSPISELGPTAWQAADEIEMLRAAIDKVLSAINNHGPAPAHHLRIMKQHRTQWPTLWNALDLLQEARRK